MPGIGNKFIKSKSASRNITQQVAIFLVEMSSNILTSEDPKTFPYESLLFCY